MKALAKLEAMRDMDALRTFVDEGPQGKRRLPRLSSEDLEGLEGETRPDLEVDDEEEEWDEEAVIDPSQIDEIATTFELA